MLENFFYKIWYGKKRFFWSLLWPFSLVYGFVVWVRQNLYRMGTFKTYHVPCKVIIVGNQTIGGGGKTPMVIALVDFFQSQGKQVGVICKGYKGSLTHTPQIVELQKHTPYEVGDEAILLKQKVSCAVVAANNRFEGAAYLSAHTNCDIIISDDGLTHLALHRDLEIILESQGMGVGNGSLLPAGPLREKFRSSIVSRLFVNSMTLDNAQKANAMDEAASLTTSYAIYRYPGDLYHVRSKEVVSTQFFKEKKITAIAAIAHPQNFFDTLHQLGLHFTEKAYPDHYLFKQSDFSKDEVYIMTEKDAVKCDLIDCENLYALSLKTSLSANLCQALSKFL